MNQFHYREKITCLMLWRSLLKLLSNILLCCILNLLSNFGLELQLMVNLWSLSGPQSNRNPVHGLLFQLNASWVYTHGLSKIVMLCLEIEYGYKKLKFQWIFHVLLSSKLIPALLWGKVHSTTCLFGQMRPVSQVQICLLLHRWSVLDQCHISEGFSFPGSTQITR